MRTKLLVIAVSAFGLVAGGALAKGGPPPKDPKEDHGQPVSHDAKDQSKDAANSTKAQTKATTQAAKDAAKELKFKRETSRLGYTCRGGTTHLEGIVVSVTPSTATAPGSLTITVTKGNSRGKTLVGTEVTVSLLASTEVIRKGHSTVAALVPGDRVRIDARSCTPPDTDTTDGIAPAAGLVARRVF